MKLPNGFGSIIKLSGRRRRPYAVRHNNHYLAYFSTRADALLFLADFNQSPTIFADGQSFGDLFCLELKERTAKISPKTVKGYKSAFQHCQSIQDKKIKDIRVTDLQGIISRVCASGAGQPTQKKVRQIFHNVFRYAVKYQLISASADISHYVDIDQLKRKYKKSPFNTRQINRVKAIADSDSALAPWAKIVVMMCYCGTRPGEFIAIEKSDVKLKSRYFIVRASKTAAGRNRPVPISKKVLPYFEWWMTSAGKMLVSIDGAPVSYTRLLKNFDKVMTAARCSHKPHECRHTCATWLDARGADKLSIKRILGHATTDVTDGVYIHKSISQLKKAIDLL